MDACVPQVLTGGRGTREEDGKTWYHTVTCCGTQTLQRHRQRSVGYQNYRTKNYQAALHFPPRTLERIVRGNHWCRTPQQPHSGPMPRGVRQEAALTCFSFHGPAARSIRHW
ncbi:uncharacterized protein LOC135102051 [Scylla paramamosain]|uniref:uncharacterized protein LOC135102051 n=1 Tax=Scylla paramamosain TaxID=85552 RepID=UPI003083A479